MFRYSQFDFPEMANNSKMLRMIINIIIISFIIIVLYININTKDDVKIISTNSRRIITTLNNYTETMSEFIVSNNELNENTDELNEIKNIRFTINYFKELKEAELKQQELKLEELKQQELKQQELKQQELKLEELENKKNKAISLIKSYIPNYDNLIRLSSSHIEIDGYSNNNNCMKEMIKINREELFNNLIKIDYENNEVSFNYLDNTNNDYYRNTDNIIRSHLYADYDKNNRYYNYSHYIYRNYKDNIIKNPIYQIIKNQLEIDYSYIEPNLESYYNNKSRYFSKSLNDFIETYNYYKKWFLDNNYNYDKYYERYENDTYYLYLKSINNNYIQKWNIFNEYLIENNIIINNPNPIDIYNKHSYKFICEIPSKSLTTNEPSIKFDYYNDITYFTAHIEDNIYIQKPIITNINDIEKALNIDYNLYIESYYWKIGSNYNLPTYYGASNIINFNKYIYELDKNKGTRMIKHNLTDNIPSYNIFEGKSWYDFYIENHYFIEKVYINFPLIEIYDEYDYIKEILSNIADIYNLPIIPSIKFI
jgi:hypothetical protein